VSYYYSTSFDLLTGISVVLSIWDALANGVTSDKPLQPAQDFGQAKDLLQELASMLEIFEVAIESLLDMR